VLSALFQNAATAGAEMHTPPTPAKSFTFTHN